MPGAGWIAAVSYSLYLSHKLVFVAVERGLGDTLAGRGLLTFGVYAIATALGGAVLHYAIERPALQMRGQHRQRSGGSAQPAVRVAASTD